MVRDFTADGRHELPALDFLRRLSPGMNATRRGAMPAIRNSRAHVAVSRAAEPAANAAAKFLARTTMLRRIRIIEDQFLDTHFLARLSIRETPLEQHALGSAAARVAKAGSVARCIA